MDSEAGAGAFSKKISLSTVKMSQRQTPDLTTEQVSIDLLGLEDHADKQIKATTSNTNNNKSDNKSHPYMRSSLN